MPRLTFPTDQVVGTLTWPGVERNGPVLATGDVVVPDRVEVSLSVTLIESARLADPGWMSSRSVWTNARGDRWSREDSGSHWVQVGSRRPAHLGFLRDLPGDSITELNLRWPIVSESFPAVTHLAAGLRRLCLAETGLTDEALVSVARLRGLTYLQSWGNQFTDEGIQQLAVLSGLVGIALEEQTLSAAAFQFASRLPRLTWVGLQDVPITTEELADLRARLPDVKIA